MGSEVLDKTRELVLQRHFGYLRSTDHRFSSIIAGLPVRNLKVAL